MGDAADDARDREEELEIDIWLHEHKKCYWDCPYCQMERKQADIDSANRELSNIKWVTQNTNKDTRN